MMTVRPPAVAGMFYPAGAVQLQGVVDQLLAAAPVPAVAQPKVLILPHAGYPYSGATAAAGYATLKAAVAEINRVVLLGPAHRVAFRGVAWPTVAAFRTPLGDVMLDRQAISRLAGLSAVGALDKAHQLEHSLEVHLPFLQRLLPDARLVPLVVGEASAEEVAAVLDRLWGGAETLIVISTDLSHYLDYAAALQRDGRTAERILALDLESLSYEDACGRNPLRGALLAARQRGLQCRQIHLCNSGDTAGPRDRVVGYGAFALQ
jgi:MEMO1 family protein